MKYAYSAAQLAFKQEVEAFLSEHLPAGLAHSVRCGAGISKDQLAAWTRVLNAKGWAAPHWPVAHGGTGWNLVHRHIFDVACREYHAPQLSAFGFSMVGPAIAKYGTVEQQAKYLPQILNADLWFCQGYSEPQAGSDLASLRTKAERLGDQYIVNGQKIWTSAAEDADWIFCLVRTDMQVQQQKGISFLLIDMSSPGVTVKPLYAFNGKRLWNQVFFEDVHVPVSQRLGEENFGWTVAKSLLGDERLLVSRVAENKRILSILIDTIEHEYGVGENVPASLAAEMTELEIRLQALEVSSLRMLSKADAGAQFGAEPSMLKLKGSQLVQDLDELLFRAVGHLVLARDRAPYASQTLGAESFSEPFVGSELTEFVASGRYHHRGYTIAGGSSEVQYNIMAKQVLGL